LRFKINKLKSINQKEAETFAHENGLAFYEASAKEGINVKQIFFDLGFFFLLSFFFFFFFFIGSRKNNINLLFHFKKKSTTNSTWW